MAAGVRPRGRKLAAENSTTSREVALGEPLIKADDVSHKRRMEIYAFLIITAVLMPMLTVAAVGTWGLTVWIYQMINGPPGPPKK
jgi:nitrate reductase NapE